MILFSSQRLNFYKLDRNFLEDFIAMDMDPEVMTFYTNRPHGTREYALESFKRYEDYVAHFPQLGGFVAISKDSHEFIGLGVLIHLELNPENSSHEVGYRLPKSSWGKGYATEICRALVEYGFEVLKFSEILGTTHPDHIVSQKVLLKCGLEEIGRSTNYGGSTVFKIKK